jgi:hypothetical protein
MAQTHINAACAGNRDDCNSQTLGYFNPFVKGKNDVFYITSIHVLTSTFNDNSPYCPGMYLEQLKTQKSQTEQSVCELMCEHGTSQK